MIKEHFRKYNDLCSRIKELEQKVYELKLNMYSLTGIQYDKIPSEPSMKDILVSQIAEIDEIQQEIKDLTLKKQSLRIKHLKEISQVNEEKYRQILRCWYLLKLDVSSIEKTMNISRQHVYKLKKEAEKAFCDKMRHIDTVCDKET